MPEATVLRSFDLVRHDGTEQRFMPGTVNFTDADYEHWQVQGNIVGGNTLPPKPGSYEYHQLQPAIQNINNLMAEQQAREVQAKAEEEAGFVEQRSKSAAERSKKYSEELDAASKASTKDMLDKQQKFQSVFSTQAHQGYKTPPEGSPKFEPTKASEQETRDPSTDNTDLAAANTDGSPPTAATADTPAMSSRVPLKTGASENKSNGGR